jgi:hypothetical protein
MARICQSAVPRSRRRPLAACVASLFALSAPAAAIADSWIVDSCDEASFPTGLNHGTLRYALANATDPAFIDATGLTACADSKISLMTGQLSASAANVTITGPGKDVLQIDASLLACTGGGGQYCDNRVIAHYGTGSLTIQSIGLTGGYDRHYHANATGGCLYSKGNVTLTDAGVSTCKIFSQYGNADGGGVFTLKNLVLNGSTISGSTATSYGITKGAGLYAAGTVALNDYSSLTQSYAQGASTYGGGAYSKGDLTLEKGSVGFNKTRSSTGKAFGGGLYANAKLTVTGGAIYHNSTYAVNSKAIGGGIYVRGAANVVQGWMKYNTAKSASDAAYGGGAYVRGDFTLNSSNVYKNEVTSLFPSSKSEGGGIRGLGAFVTAYSTIRDNTAHGFSAKGGGLDLTGNIVMISSSTISGNKSEDSHAGLRFFTGGTPGTLFQIKNSTISGNQAAGLVGGLYVDAATARFYNSTIAFNMSVGINSGPGVRLRPPAPSMAVKMQSTLISNNTYGTFENDLDVVGLNPAVFNGGDLAAAANNLIYVTFVGQNIPPSNLPADTKQGFCPHLGRLRDNGGLTSTHALLSHSAAIDAGNTNVGGIPFDQRGSAANNGTTDYTRKSSLIGNPDPKPDIGAYEVQQADVVFDADFDGCVPPPV